MQKLSTNQELLKTMLANGVIIIAPDSVYIEGDIEVGQGAVIYPQVFLTNVKIGENCRIGPTVEITDSEIGANAKILFGAQIKKSKIGKNFKMHHHGYLGNAAVGDHVNYAAGAITCNYDGKNKYKTVIENNVFIGCNVNLVAPITIGKGCYIAAGSTIKANLETGENNLIICREKEVYIKELKIQNNV